MMAEDYTIIRTMRMSVMDLTGIPSMGYRVYFQLPINNIVDFVEVTEANYTPEIIDDLIETKVEQHTNVNKL